MFLERDDVYGLAVFFTFLSVDSTNCFFVFFCRRLSVGSSNCSTPFCVFRTRSVHSLVVIHVYSPVRHGIVNELTIPTNRSIRQSCTVSLLSLMKCNCSIDDCTCRIGSKLFHLTNRTNRSNRQHFVHFLLMKCNFPIGNK